MRQRRETVEHPFGTLKMRMGATHFLMKTLPKVAGEMALHVLAYNLTRVMNIVDIKPLMAAIAAWDDPAATSAAPESRSGWTDDEPGCLPDRNRQNMLETVTSQRVPPVASRTH